MANPGGGGMYSPPGWVNSTTPGNATVLCGNVSQTEMLSVDGTNTLLIPFVVPATWSDLTSWIPDDDGIHWTCVTPGIYSVQVTQNLTINNPAEIINPVVNVIISISSDITTELNQTLETSILCPATTTNSQIVNVSVSGIINADVGSIMTASIISPSGNIAVTSGPTELPSTGCVLRWNLIALGEYGNIGVIV